MGINSLYLKVGAVLAIVALLLGIGFKAGGWKCAAKQVAVINEIRAEMELQATAFAAQQAIDAVSARELSDNLAASRRSTEVLRRKLNDATLTTGDCDRPFSAEFARLFNDAVRSADAGSPETD